MKIYGCVVTESVSLWHREVLWTLRDMGHELFTPTNIGLNESWYRLSADRWSYRHRRRLSDRLLDDVKRVMHQHGLDLFFAYIWPFQFDPPVFKAIERLGIPTVLLYSDNLNSHTIMDRFAPYFTLTWVPELKAVELYKRRGRTNIIYLPMAANPNFNKPVPREECRDVVFVGMKNPYRRWLLGSLLTQGLPLEIYGGGWHETSYYFGLDDPTTPPTYEPLSRLERVANRLDQRLSGLRALRRYGLRPKLLRKQAMRMGEEYETLVQPHASPDPVSHDRLMELYAESRVTLGINHYIDPWYADLYTMTYSRARDLEAPMSGACYLTQYTEELDLFYPEEGIIMTYRAPKELREKAEQLLKDQGLRDRMRARARQFCLEHHTWQHRFQALFKHLGLAGER